MTINLSDFDEDEKQPEKHLSNSQISAYVRCPLTYFWRYVKGLKSPPAASMVLGSALHKAFEHNYNQKIYSHKDVSLEMVRDVFSDEWKRASKDAVYDPEKNESSEDFERAGLMMVEKYHTEVAPRIQPKLIEHRFMLTIAGLARPVLGFIDLIDDNDVIVDHKTSKAVPNALTLAKDFQLVLYKMAFRAKFGKDPKGLRYDYIVRKSSKKTGDWAEIHPMPVEKNASHEFAMVEHFKTVLNGIKMAFFHQPDQYSFICTPTGCGFWNNCAGRIQRGEKPEFLDEIRELQMQAAKKLIETGAL